MFANEFTIPMNLLKAEALERRTFENHRSMPELRTFIKNTRSGYNGERKISYYLGQIPTQRFYIFYDLRLPYGNAYFQIDALLLSTKAILMLDGKNHYGKLLIEKNQMIQEFQDSRVVYENPISQANRHNLLLTYFLENHKIPILPINSYVVITNSSTEVRVSPDYMEAANKVCRLSDLLRKIDEFYHHNNKELVDNKTLEKLKRLLLKSHTPLQIDILAKYNIAKSEIRTGVQCPNCLSFPMIYKRTIWLCPICHFISQDAYLTAIKDYFLLISPAFTNREIRAFLHLPNTRGTTYFISSLHFPFTGTTKGRVYHQPKDYL